jgi:G3E family GTPase
MACWAKFLPGAKVESTAGALETMVSDLAATAAVQWDKQPPELVSGDSLETSGTWQELQVEGAGPFSFQVEIQEPGALILLTEHLPEEFALQYVSSAGPIPALVSRTFVPEHEHDDEVTSVCVVLPRPVDPVRFDQYVGQLLRTKGTDLYRLKGIVAVGRDPRRWILQGVHMLFDMDAAGVWGEEEPVGKVVLIGRNLDSAALKAGMLSCMVTA